LQWILVRDANYRPTINDCTLRFNYVRKLIFDELRKNKGGGDAENSQSNDVLSQEDPTTPPSAGPVHVAGHERSASTSTETFNINVISQDKMDTKELKEEERGRRKEIGSVSKMKGMKPVVVHSKSKKLSRRSSQKRDEAKGSIRSRSKTRKGGTIKGTSATKQRPKVSKDHFKDPKTIKPMEFDEEEIKFFVENPTKITTYLFLGLYACTEDKKRLKTKYDITHIVNCTNEPNRWEDHFVYLNIKVDENMDISQHFPQFFEFVRTAAKAKGKVLVCSSELKSDAAALVIAFLMDTKKLSFFEAFQHVHKRRYIVQLHPKLQSIISRWGSRMAEDRSETFSCICGKCTWTLLQPFDKTEKQNPIPCLCSYEDSAECPNIGCKHFVEEMKQQHNWPEQPLQWGTTTRDNVQSINPEYVDEFSPMDLVPVHLHDRVTSKKDWKLFKCRNCAFITHAENKSDPNVIVIVTNIPVVKSSDKTAASHFTTTPIPLANITNTTNTSSATNATNTTNTVSTTNATNATNTTNTVSTTNATSTTNTVSTTNATNTTNTSSTTNATNVTTATTTPNATESTIAANLTTTTVAPVSSTPPNNVLINLPTASTLQTQANTNTTTNTTTTTTTNNNNNNKHSSHSVADTSVPSEPTSPISIVISPSKGIPATNSPRVRPVIPKLTLITSPRSDKSDKN
jgi:hypothetical protein